MTSSDRSPAAAVRDSLSLRRSSSFGRKLLVTAACIFGPSPPPSSAARRMALNSRPGMEGATNTAPSGNCGYSFTNWTMSDFANSLSMTEAVGRPVLDYTGLEGRYWFQANLSDIPKEAGGSDTSDGSNREKMRWHPRHRSRRQSAGRELTAASNSDWSTRPHRLPRSPSCRRCITSSTS